MKERSFRAVYRRSRFLQITLAVGLLVGAGAAAEDGKRPMTPIDMLEIPNLSDPQLSPDGRQLLYTLGEADWKANRQIRHVWRVDRGEETAGGEPLQLTYGEKGESSPRWSPDGRLIAFLATRGDDKKQQIYLLDNRGGEARQLSDHETAVDDITWSPNGEHLYFTAPDPKSKEQKKRDKAKDDVFAFDENFQQIHLWKISVADKAASRITEGEYSILQYKLSRDGSRFAVSRAPSPLFDDADEREIWVMDADGGNVLRLSENTAWERDPALSPDNQTVLFTAGNNETFEPYYDANLFLVPAAGGASRLLLAEMRHGVQQAEWSADGRSIYFVANTGVRTELFRVDVETEELQRLTEGDHTIGSWSYEDTVFPPLESPRGDTVPSGGSRGGDTVGRHVFTINDPTNAGDVWTLPADGGTPDQWTHVFEYLDRDFLVPRQEWIRYEGADGVTVEGLLFHPLDAKKGKPAPLVVQTHGGPASSDKFRFGRWVNYEPVLSAMGYAVFKPNYRGSTGYGDDFLRDMVGHYYHQAHLDVMAGVDHLIELGIADGERLVKMGWSAGGHMTNKIITFTDRFKAASSGAGAVNWISMYGQSDVRIYRTPWFGGTPWQEDAPIDVYWQHSPLSEIAKVKTPTLVLVGENDVRVPAAQSIELYRALKTNGVATHLYMAPRAGHGWRELRHRLFKINVELEWFERYARGREYTWAEAPETEETDDTKSSPQ